MDPGLVVHVVDYILAEVDGHCCCLLVGVGDVGVEVFGEDVWVE